MKTEIPVKVTANVYLDLTVKCAHCGEDLAVSHDNKAKPWPTIEVEPCPCCWDDAFEQGADQSVRGGTG